MATKSTAAPNMTKPTVTPSGLGSVQGFGPGQDMGRIDSMKGAIPMSTNPIASSIKIAAFSPFIEEKFLRMDLRLLIRTA
jgi:hypothetical protein